VNQISPSEIPYFRGAVIHSMEHANVLFHNHIGDDNFRYSYPLIQYKRINQRASIIGIEEGADAIAPLLAHGDFAFRLGNRDTTMKIENAETEKAFIGMHDGDIQHYSLHSWLPLNEENYRKYLQLEKINDKIELLENILVANLLSFFKSMNIFFENKVIAEITDINNKQEISFKDVKLLSFDICFKTNVLLPNYIGIGKNASLGFGIITSINHKH
jgi:hypothetical protein